MKFLLDANVRHSVGTFLESEGYDVRFLAGTAEHGLSDSDALALATRESRILITNDKDFGQLIFRQKLPHKGVILFRLSEESRASYLGRLKSIVEMYNDRLVDHFVVVTDEHVRFR
ncbi:hypothetical protein EPN90_00085 [Patescibacteria group bacterium]|nr:MAG: hypothetical protein EPN90_00085 [Patescibacteria group bacterium]